MRKVSVYGREGHPEKEAGDRGVSPVRDHHNRPAPALFAPTIRVQVNQKDIPGSKRRGQRRVPLYSGYSSLAEAASSSNPAAAHSSASAL